MITYVATQDVPLDRLGFYPGNARRGDIQMIRESLRTNGQYRSLIVRKTEDDHLVVLAGNHTLKAMLAEEMTTARCEIYTCDDATALRVNLVDNRAQDVAEYDDELLLDLLRDLDGSFLGTGYDDHDLQSLLTRLDEPAWEEQREREIRETREVPATDQPDAVPGPSRSLTRSVPIDAVFSMIDFRSISMAAYEMGFLPGIISSSLYAARRLMERIPGIRLGFMDNDWKNYVHSDHVAAVAETRPKYATVRDIMTREQCEAAGVDFYPLPQILEMAEEISEYADNVIIIPKYDCLDQLPDQYITGFSVPTSYGGTPMPASALKGRRVHLLGGSWKNQRTYLDILGDDVVSFDNNHLLKISKWGYFTYSDGTKGRLSEEDNRFPRAWQVPAIISLASIRDELNARYGGMEGTPEDAIPDTSEYGHDEDDDEGEDG
jgi:hypothetical protein